MHVQGYSVAQDYLSKMQANNERKGNESKGRLSFSVGRNHYREACAILEISESNETIDISQAEKLKILTQHSRVFLSSS